MVNKNRMTLLSARKYLTVVWVVALKLQSVPLKLLLDLIILFIIRIKEKKRLLKFLEISMENSL